MMVTKIDLIRMCRVIGAYSAGLSKRGSRLLSLWAGVGGGVFRKSYCGEQNKMTTVLVYKRKFG